MDELTIALSQARCGKITDEARIAAVQNRYHQDVYQKAQNDKSSYEALFAFDPETQPYAHIFAAAAAQEQQGINTFPQDTCDVTNDPSPVNKILTSNINTPAAQEAKAYVQEALSDGIYTKREYLDTVNYVLRMNGVRVVLSPSFHDASKLLLQNTQAGPRADGNAIHDAITFGYLIQQGSGVTLTLPSVDRDMTPEEPGMSF